MNDRIKELAEQASLYAVSDNSSMVFDVWKKRYTEKFAELIIQECVNTIQNRAPGQLGKAGDGWTNGYDDGLKTGAFLIKQHFGIKE